MCIIILTAVLVRTVLDSYRPIKAITFTIMTIFFYVISLFDNTILRQLIPYLKLFRLSIKKKKTIPLSKEGGLLSLKN